MQSPMNQIGLGCNIMHCAIYATGQYATIGSRTKRRVNSGETILKYSKKLLLPVSNFSYSVQS